MNCEKAIQIHAYHDGELSAADRAAVESHLALCAECSELLAELRELSNTLATVDLPAVSSASMNRMYGAWWETKVAQEQGIRRLAGWLTAAAAAVLVLVPWTWPTSPMEQPIVPTRSWEIMALVPPAGPDADSNADLIQVAQWFATDLSTEQGQ